MRGSLTATRRTAISLTLAAAAAAAEIAGLRQVGELLRGQVEKTRQDRDRWPEAATVALRALPEPLKLSRFWWCRRVA